MRSYLKLFHLFLRFFNILFWIFHTESLVKMSNSLWFSRIFTLQSFSWFCFNFFWLFLKCTLKRLLREWDFFNNHWIWKFSLFQFFSFPFLKFIDFKITSNSFIYSLVEQFFETHFHKNNYRGKGILLGKIWQNFKVYIPLTWSVGVCYTSNMRLLLIKNSLTYS